MIRQVSDFFIFLGVIFLVSSFAFFVERNNPKRLNFSVKSGYFKNKTEPSNSLPEEIKIDDLEIDLPILPGKISGQNWETTSVGASWLSSSPVPGENGNSIIYGHNWTNLMGNLVKAKPGQIIEIIYRDKSKKKFIINSLGVVSPQNVSILAQSIDSRITVYTCTGLFDDKRFVVVAKYKKSFD